MNCAREVFMLRNFDKYQFISQTSLFFLIECLRSKNELYLAILLLLETSQGESRFRVGSQTIATSQGVEANFCLKFQ